jgi:hypothetical protein
MPYKKYIYRKTDFIPSQHLRQNSYCRNIGKAHQRKNGVNIPITFQGSSKIENFEPSELGLFS